MPTSRDGAVRFFKGATLFGVYAGLLLPLIFIPSVIFPFVFSKLIFFQVVVGLTFPAYMALAWMDRAYRPKAHLLYLAIAAYFGALLLSVVFAIDPMRAWWGNQERMNGLFTLLHFFLWLTMAIGVLKTWEQWRRLLNYEIVLSGMMAIVAGLQKLNPNLLMFTAGPRVGGLLDNPIYMAAYQIFNLFFLALLFLKVKSRNARIFYVCIALLDMMAFLLAQSRGAIVGLGVGIFAFAIYYGLFTKNKKVRFGVMAGVVTLVASYGLVMAFRETPLIKSTPLYRLTDIHGTVSTRLIAWDIAWKGFVERPLTGWGLDNFHILFNAKYNPHSLRFGAYETWFDRAHNTVMDVLSMTGLIGFMTFVSMFVMIFIVTWRAWKKSWIDLPIAAILFSLPLAYFVQNLFVFDHPAGFSMSFLLYALIIAATRGEFVGQKDTEEIKILQKPAVEAHHGAPWIAFAILQLVMVFVVWRTSLLPFRASTLAIRSNIYFSSNPAAAFDFAKQASAIWTPYLDEQSFLMARNMISLIGSGNMEKIKNWQEMYALAKQLSEEEIRRHPRNTHPLYIYARLAQDMAPIMQTEGAVSEQNYLKAIETSPKRQQLHYGLARLYLMAQQKDLALEIMKKVRDFDPDLGEGYWSYGLSLLYDKQDFVAGSEQVVKALLVPYRYEFRDGRELIVYVESAALLQKKDAIDAFMSRIEVYPPANADMYARMAFRMNQAGWVAERDRVLDYGQTVDPATKDTYTKLLAEVEAGERASAEEPPPPEAPLDNASVSVTESSVASTRTPSGPVESGPRR